MEPDIVLLVQRLMFLLEIKMDHYSHNQKNSCLSIRELSMHVERCALNDRESQKKIYNSFYGYAMAICNRYSSNGDDVVEIINDGFLKIFKEIHRYKPAYSDVLSSFKGWLRKIMVYTAIDHFRRNQKHQQTSDLDNGVVQFSAGTIDPLNRISYQEILLAIKELSPSYRTVFNLFVIDGLTHEEISQQLGISIGTSKSNLAKARKQIQKMLVQLDRTA